jgi:hypothetical protein
MDDTSPEARRVLIDIYRRMTMAQKWCILGDAWQTARVLAEAGYRSGHPRATADELYRHWLRVTLGAELSATVLEHIRQDGRREPESRAAGV